MKRIYLHTRITITALIFAFFMVLFSVIFTHYLSRKFAEEEGRNIAMWAEATQQFILADENTNIDFVSSIIEGNTTIPVYLLDSQNHVLLSRNVKRPAPYPERLHGPIEVKISSDVTNYIYYDDSVYIKLLRYMPYVELGLIVIFVLIAFITVHLARRSEQDRVWVGLTKETAHQLGTPISSLLAWQELLKNQYPDDDFLPQMSMDIDRLQMITERFSKVGSVPELTKQPIVPILKKTFDYMHTRVSKKVVMEFYAEEDTSHVCCELCVPLFAWVIENLIRNAVDAMNGVGRIRMVVQRDAENLLIDVSDTGCGIARSLFYRVFEPGFTSKTRGWGLGLSLSKRIVEDYHGGKIFIEHSQLDVGTTFRIIIKEAVDGGTAA